jgi:hypothetical protein
VAASTNKKILIRRFDREPVSGFVNPQNWQQPAGLEVLSQSGADHVVPYSEIKAAYFVREFNEAPGETRVFNTRPKMAGVWVRMRFRDGDIMDGLLPNNLLQLEPYGFTVVPPNPTSNHQRVFVPRAALDDVSVLGVVGSPLKERAKGKPKEQIGLFD